MLAEVKHKQGVVLATIFIVMGRVHEAMTATTLYLNSYSDCMRSGGFKLDDDGYEVKSMGDGPIHETLICDMTFRAPSDSGICITFRKFKIRECSISLILYQESTASGKQWRKLTCDDSSPIQMCTSERYVTIKLLKSFLNNNRDYDINILIEKSSNLTGEDVILASSIGLFVGIIVGAVALIVTMAVIVLCCCCKTCQSRQPPQGYASTMTGSGLNPQHPVQPTAPPILDYGDEITPLQSGNLYPSIPHTLHPYPAMGYCLPQQPPPYAPPPYEEHTYPIKPL